MTTRVRRVIDTANTPLPLLGASFTHPYTDCTVVEYDVPGPMYELGQQKRIIYRIPSTTEN